MAWPVGWTQLPLLAPGQRTIARAISRDGTTVVGDATSLAGQGHPAIWTQTGGLVDIGIGTSDGTGSALFASGNGSIVSFYNVTGAASTSFLWTIGSTVALPEFPGSAPSSTEATAISADGGVIAGTTALPITDGFQGTALRYTVADGWSSIGVIAGFFNNTPSAISADGTTIVGYSSGDVVGGLNVSDNDHAWYWTQASGMVDLGFLPGHGFCRALAVSADGSVIVGMSDVIPSQFQPRAFRWTQAEGQVDLGLLPGGTQAQAYGVSDDGTVVVGSANNTDFGSIGFIWTAATGMVAIPISDPTVWYSTVAGISGDGRVIVGEWVLNTSGHLNMAAVYVRPSSTGSQSQQPVMLIG